MPRTSRLYFAALVLLLPLVSSAQEKQRLSTLNQAMQAGRQLSGPTGHRIFFQAEDGIRFSYTDRDPSTNTPIIRAYDPATNKDTVLFSTTRLTLPGTTQPFAYDSFQWAQDSKHLVFQTNFQPI